jgi:DNA-binding CsgD family transcriptional regulator
MIAWGSTRDRILILLEQEPMTKAEICRRLELSHDQVASVLSQLKKKSKRFPKRIYISGHTRHAISGRTYIRALYALGSSPDKKPEIKPFTLKERSARSYFKLMATRNNSIFNLTKTKREIIREKAQSVQAKTNKDSYEQSTA